MKYISIVDWDKYQHYKKEYREGIRRMSWIKFYPQVIDSEKIWPLSHDMRYIYFALLLLSSRKNNYIPYNLRYIKERICHHKYNIMRLEKTIISLKNAGLIRIIGSKSIPKKYQSATLDKIRIDKIRIYKKNLLNKIKIT